MVSGAVLSPTGDRPTADVRMLGNLNFQCKAYLLTLSSSRVQKVEKRAFPLRVSALCALSTKIFMSNLEKNCQH